MPDKPGYPYFSGIDILPKSSPEQTMIPSVPFTVARLLGIVGHKLVFLTCESPGRPRISQPGHFTSSSARGGGDSSLGRLKRLISARGRCRAVFVVFLLFRIHPPSRQTHHSSLLPKFTLPATRLILRRAVIPKSGRGGGEGAERPRRFLAKKFKAFLGQLLTLKAVCC